MLLHLNFESDTPIYQQIRNQIVMGIADGKLPARSKTADGSSFVRRMRY